MVKVRHQKTDRRGRGRWNHDSVLRIMLKSGFVIHSASALVTNVSKTKRGKLHVIEIPWANKSGDLWKPTKWNNWLRGNRLNVTSDHTGDTIVGPHG